MMRTSESKDTSKTYDSSAALNPKFATDLAAMPGELRVRGTRARRGRVSNILPLGRNRLFVKIAWDWAGLFDHISLPGKKA